MDASKRLQKWMHVLGIVIVVSAASEGSAAAFRTQNFIVDAPTAQLAAAVGNAAEQYRQSLADHWLGTTLPPWRSPCPIRVIAGANLAAQGVTEYNRAPVRDFRMEVVGTPERILDSVLPHEVTHTILATHFGRPLPRWADEGICTTVEHADERAKHEIKLREFLSSRRGIAMNRLFLLTEYPSDVLPMYAQGYSVCRFLIEQSGPQEFIRFLGDYMREPSWTKNIRSHYGYDSLAQLQQRWLSWVSDGSGSIDPFVATPEVIPVSAVASRTQTKPTTAIDRAVPRESYAATASLNPPLQRGGSQHVGSRRDGSWYGRGDSKPAAGTALAAIGAMAPPSVRTAGQYGVLDRNPRSSLASAGPPASPSSYQAATPQAESSVGRFRVPLPSSTGHR